MLTACIRQLTTSVSRALPYADCGKMRNRRQCLSDFACACMFAKAVPLLSQELWQEPLTDGLLSSQNLDVQSEASGHVYILRLLVSMFRGCRLQAELRTRVIQIDLL